MISKNKEFILLFYQNKRRCMKKIHFLFKIRKKGNKKEIN